MMNEETQPLLAGMELGPTPSPWDIWKNSNPQWIEEAWRATANITLSGLKFLGELKDPSDFFAGKRVSIGFEMEQANQEAWQRWGEEWISHTSGDLHFDSYARGSVHAELFRRSKTSGDVSKISHDISVDTSQGTVFGKLTGEFEYNETVTETKTSSYMFVLQFEVDKIRVENRSFGEEDLQAVIELLRPADGRPAEKLPLIWDSVVRMDSRAYSFMGLLGGKGIPRSWKDTAKWDDLIQEEVQRLLMLPEEKTFANETPLLRTQSGVYGKRVELSPYATKTLRERAGLSGYREIVADADGVRREYLTKYIKGPKGTLLIRLSWYNTAGIFGIDEEAEIAKATQATLYEDSSEEIKQERENRLKRFASIRDARIVCDAVLRMFGAAGENPVEIPAYELRSLIGGKDKANWFRQLEGAFLALQELRYDLTQTGPDNGRAYGPLINDVRFVGGGPGAHKDGVFYVTLSMAAIGCLAAFKHRSEPLRQGAEMANVDIFDWTAPANLKGKQTSYFRNDTRLNQHFSQSVQLTPTQSQLLDWMLSNITRNSDGTTAHRRMERVPKRSQTAPLPRVYTSSFCPLLGTGRFHGVFGHFASGRNAEAGWKLDSIREFIGIDAAKERSERAAIVKTLADLNHVIHVAFGGIAALRYGKSWVTFNEAEKAHDEARAGLWALFLPEAYVTIMQQKVAAHTGQEVTSDIARWRASFRGRRPGRQSSPDEVVSLTDDSMPLHVRLKRARQEKGFTQAQMADLFGVKQPHIASWESGSRERRVPGHLVQAVEQWIREVTMSATPKT